MRLDLLLEVRRARPEWMARGACRGSTVNFVPDSPGKGIPADVSAAVAICQRCPVIARCLEHAEIHGETGVWGGTTGRQRRARSAA